MQELRLLIATVVLHLLGIGCFEPKSEVRLTSKYYLFYAEFADREFIIQTKNSRVVGPAITEMLVTSETICGYVNSKDAIAESGYFVLTADTNYFGLKRAEMEKKLAETNKSKSKPILLHHPSYYFK